MCTDQWHFIPPGSCGSLCTIAVESWEDLVTEIPEVLIPIGTAWGQAISACVHSSQCQHCHGSSVHKQGLCWGFSMWGDVLWDLWILPGGRFLCPIQGLAVNCVLSMGLWWRGRLDPGQNWAPAIWGYDLKHFVSELACCLYAILMQLYVVPGACQILRGLYQCSTWILLVCSVFGCASALETYKLI